MAKRDPVEARADRSRDLYDIATWEPRSALDRVSVGIYRLAVVSAKGLLVLVALAFMLLIGAVGALADVFVLLLTVLSAVPALALAAYVYRNDITSGEPLTLVSVTFLLAIVFASFAAVVNTIVGGLFGVGVGATAEGLLAVTGSVLFFFLVVGPIEETVKLLAVRFVAYRDDRFDAVVDGAVYGAVAGLGFAFVENAIYIARSVESVPIAGGDPSQQFAVGGATAAVRALAGPGHVIYSAFAGYYLGLAKFNPDRAGPIVVKGLVIAALVHATYNSLVTVGLAWVVDQFGVDGAAQLLVLFGFVVVYLGFFGYLLYRKLRAYTTAYRDVMSDAERSKKIAVDRTEFDG